MNLIYILGKSSSGKDTIYKKLIQELNIKTYISYTTRPMRSGEIDKVTYNFITNEEMEKYINGEKDNKIIEYRTYKTAHGPWTYATIDDEQFRTTEDLATIGTLESYEKIMKYFEENKNINIMPIYIEVPDNIRLRRAIEREEQGKGEYLELCRRFIADSKDFSEENLKKFKIDKRFQNIELNKCLDEIKDYIKDKRKGINSEIKEPEEKEER